MPLKAKFNKDFFIKDESIHLSIDFLNENKKKFKKITGSRLASILNLNQYNSPLKTWMMMTNIYFEEMDETLSITGNIVEPILRDYVVKNMGIKYKDYNPYSVKWDVFKENKIFGGIPDGEPVDENGNFLYDQNIPMIEIKTTSIDSLVYKKVDGVLRMQKDTNNVPLVKIEKGKLQDWYVDGKLSIPKEYELQLSLYLYLRNAPKGLFVIGFLEKEDYATPNNFDPTNRKIEYALIELNRKEFEKVIEKCTDWYKRHIECGISPKITNEDKKWLSEVLQVNNL